MATHEPLHNSILVPYLQVNVGEGVIWGGDGGIGRRWWYGEEVVVWGGGGGMGGGGGGMERRW